MRPFHHLLVNNLAANITNYTVWFAITFWMFLETRSVFATGMIAGLFLILTSGLGIWFGSLVDHHGKRRMMIVSSAASLLLYALALAAYLVMPAVRGADTGGVALWLFVLVTMLGVIAGNIRMIALPTLVTILIPADQRDKANGLVGIVNGIGFLTTSAISGFLVAWGGMGATLAAAAALSLAAALHLAFVRVAEPVPAPDDLAPARVDLAGTMRIVLGIPGLAALILFTAFNNFLGGVFMALMDAYGLSMMRVEQWGLLWAVTSTAFILSGVLISRTGLGKNPVRTLLLINVAVWLVAALFTVQASILLLAIGCFLWMFLGPVAEAAEQTVLQRVVPLERQGRVFGFAQSVESAASPLTAFLIAPLTQFIVIPFMTTGVGADAIGDWFGRGPDRGMALVFTVAGLVGLIATLFALRSRAYRRISAAFAAAPPDSFPPPPEADSR
jgi:MFS transporter, DHA3 family, multidrug efflux protein